MVESMKRVLFLASLLAIVAGGCTKEDTQNIAAESKTTIKVTAELDEMTRTYVDGQKIKWSETGEQLNIIYYADDDSSNRRQTATDTDYTIDAEGRIEFSADFSTTDGAKSYTLGAFYPYAYKSTTSSINLTVPQTQTPTADSYDPTTDILVSKEPVVVEGTPVKVKFTFARMVAFAKMTLKGIGAGETIQKVTFYSSAKPAGAVDFKVHEAATVENAKWYNNCEDITITRENWVATGEDVVWMTTVPTDLSGTDFTVTVVTDQYTYTKSVDLTDKTLTFERGDVAVFTVKDLQRQEKPKAYKLLTDINELNAGDQILLCTKNTESSSAKLLSTTADGNALKFTQSVTVGAGLEISAEGLPADAAILDVESGATAGTFALKDINKGYLYGTYDSENWSSKLNYKDSKDREASWTISINSSSAVTAYAYYSDTAYRYLNNYYGSKFNFAGSTSTYYYYIYYLDGKNTDEGGNEGGEEPTTTPLATPVVTASALGDVVTVSWDAVAGAKDYTVTCGTATTTVTATTATFEGVAAGTYEVKVVANPADTTLYTASEAGTASVTVEAAPAQTYMIELVFPFDGVTGGADVGSNISIDDNIYMTCTGSWRTIDENDWNGIYMGSGKTLTFAAKDSSKYQLTKIELKSVDGNTINTDKGSLWEGTSGSVTFTAKSGTRVASAVVYYTNK